MTKTYLEWVDAQLEYHQTEVARLTIARGVLEQAAEALLAARGSKEPPQKQIVHKVKPEEKRTHRRYEDGTVWRNRVIEELERNGPQDSGTMIEKLGFKSKDDKQKIYNALSHLKMKGKLDKSETGVYSIPTLHHGLAATG